MSYQQYPYGRQDHYSRPEHMYSQYPPGIQDIPRQQYQPGPPQLRIPSQMPPAQQSHQSYPTYNNMSAGSSNMPSSSSNVPPSPSEKSAGDEERNLERLTSLPGIPPVTKVYNGKVYALVVGQEPMRARMCGFGDKDRRPISPPPCIRLVITDEVTGKEIDYKDAFGELSTFVIHVDMVNLNMEEQNMVQHPSPSPSISTVTSARYPMTTSAHSASMQTPGDYDYLKLPHVYSSQDYAQPQQPQYPVNGGGQNQYYANGNGNGYPRGLAGYPDSRYTQGYSTMGLPGYPVPQHRGSADSLGSRDPLTGVKIRSLIGQVSSSANRLVDLNKNTGLWFVFQDLSVRQEGIWRLKFSFFDLQDGQNEDGSSNESNTSESIMLAKQAPMLAQIYSKPFQVYSAKKFPGVADSTPLSKEFAKQGIKIPIRKDDGKKRKGVNSNSPEDDDDDARSE